MYCKQDKESKSMKNRRRTYQTTGIDAFFIFPGQGIDKDDVNSFFQHPGLVQFLVGVLKDL